MDCDPNSDMMRRGRRGFTLVEVITVLTIGTILILMVLGWVSSLALTSATSLEQTANARDADYLTRAMTTDIQGAVDCNQYGLDVPLYSYSPTEIAFYIKDATTPTKTDLVLWQVTPSGNAERAVVTGTSTTGCNLTDYDSSVSLLNASPTAAGWVTIASNIRCTKTISSGACQFPTLVTNMNAGDTTMSVSNISSLTVGQKFLLGTGASQDTGTIAGVGGSSALGSTAVTLTSAVTGGAGTTTLAVSSSSKLLPGKIFYIDWGTVNQEAITINSIVSATSVTLSSPIQISHSALAPITQQSSTSTISASSTTSFGAHGAGTPIDANFSGSTYAGAFFTGNYKGNTVGASVTPSATNYDCTGRTTSQVPEGCYFDTIVFNGAESNANGTGAVFRISQNLNVNLSGSRLSAS